MKSLTKEQAETKLNDLAQDKPNWFCPLTRQTCNNKCLCYKLARITHSNESYRIYPHYCDNAMFTGYREEG